MISENLVLKLLGNSWGSIYFNLLLAVAPFYTPLKTSENRRFSNVFSGYKNGTSGNKGLRSV